MSKKDEGGAAEQGNKDLQKLERSKSAVGSLSSSPLLCVATGKSAIMKREYHHFEQVRPQNKISAKVPEHSVPLRRNL